MSRNVSGDSARPAARGRPRDERAHAAILTATIECFAEGGLSATTIDSVARRAGVSRSTVYRRWSTREQLVTAALQSVRGQAEASVEEWPELPLGQIMALFRRMTVAALLDDRSMALLRQVTALPKGSPVAEAYWNLVVVPRRASFRAVLERAQARGELPLGADVDLIQDQLAGTLLYRALVNPAPLSRAAARRYVDSLLTSLGLIEPES